MLRVVRALKALLEVPVLMVRLVDLDLQEPQALRVHEDQRARVGWLGLLEDQDKLGPQVPWGREDLTGRRVNPDRRGFREPREPQGPRELSERLVMSERQALQALPGQMDPMGVQGLQESLAQVVPQGQRAQPAQMGHKEALVVLVLQELLGPRVRLDWPVIKAPQGPQATRGLLELRAQLEQMGLLEALE